MQSDPIGRQNLHISINYPNYYMILINDTEWIGPLIVWRHSPRPHLNTSNWVKVDCRHRRGEAGRLASFIDKPIKLIWIWILSTDCILMYCTSVTATILLYHVYHTPFCTLAALQVIWPDVYMHGVAIAIGLVLHYTCIVNTPVRLPAVGTY
jgi:hypothetical protein